MLRRQWSRRLRGFGCRGRRRRSWRLLEGDGGGEGEGEEEGKYMLCAKMELDAISAVMRAWGEFQVVRGAEWFMRYLL